MSRVRIGLSGWRYPEWRNGAFYPKGLAQKRELDFVGKAFDTAEINGSFYSLQTPSSYARWRATVPPDFLFAVKGSRFITHMKQLANVETALANFFASGVLALGDALGPVLWQLPARTRFDEERLASFFELLPKSTKEAAALAKRHDDRLRARAFARVDADRPLRHALEARHESFATSRSLRLLERHKIALVVSDGAGTFPMFDEATADFTYVRLHGDTHLYHSGYSPKAVRTWAAKVARWATHGDTYVYFDNNVKAHAPADALALRAAVEALARNERRRSA